MEIKMLIKMLIKMSLNYVFHIVDEMFSKYLIITMVFFVVILKILIVLLMSSEREISHTLSSDVLRECAQTNGF